MAESNGGARLEAARREVEDKLIVMAHLDQRSEEQKERTKVLDERVDKLVSDIGVLIARIDAAAQRLPVA